jgi:hypothetical protein
LRGFQAGEDEGIGLLFITFSPENLHLRTPASHTVPAIETITTKPTF